MHITELWAENVKKLKVVHLTPAMLEQPVVEITGDNEAGKTSIFDSIIWALGGASNIQEQPIRKGETEAKIILTLGTGTELAKYVITRQFNENGSTMTIKSGDGAKYSSPQKMLDQLLGQLTFDPLEFTKLKPALQTGMLRQLTGIDFSQLDMKRGRLYEERRVLNGRMRDAEGQLRAMGELPSVPAEKINVEELLEKQRQLRNAVHDFEKWKSYTERVEDDAASAARAEQAAKKAYDDACANTERQYKLYLEASQKLKDFVVPTEEERNKVDQDIASAGDINQCIDAHKVFNQTKERVLKLDTEIKTATASIDLIDSEKLRMLGEAKMPIENLSFNVEDMSVLYDGVPFSQASAARQIQVSAAIAAAFNPTLKIILIKDGSLLSPRLMTVLDEWAASNGYQIWIERVDVSGDVGIFIEEGEVTRVYGKENAPK